MPTKRLAILLVVFTAAGLWPAALAENFTTNIITSATSGGLLYIVGNVGKMNYLEVRGSGGTLTDTNGIIGFAATASTNSAAVTGSGARWTSLDTLYVGMTGSVNRLTIISAGVVSNDTGCVGYDQNSRNNSVLVTGANSRWRSDSLLVIGYDGPGNSMIISNGGVVSCGFDSSLGMDDTSSSNNTVVVTGSGSAWNSDNGLYIGYVGGSNQLVIASGGAASNDFGVVGSFSSSNIVTVTGANSAWRMPTGDLTIGDSDSRQNQLIITNGGMVTSLTGTLGGFDSFGGHRAVVTGGSSRWILGDSLTVGDLGSSNLLIVQAGGLVSNVDAVVGSNVNASNNTVTVSDSGSFWKSRNLTVGDSGAGNLLTVQNSGVVSNKISYIGSGILAESNSVWVTGTGSRFVTSQDCFVGYGGCESRLIISGGAQVNNSNTWVGGTVDSCNTTLMVTDPGSVLSNAFALQVAFDGTSNGLVITNGAKAISSFGRVGTYGFLSWAVVTGTNSFWIDNGDLYVGQVGAGTQLKIENGGAISNLTGYAGLFSHNATVTVTGPGSRWNNRSDLYVNYGGVGHQLIISNGGLVSNVTGYVGYSGSSGTDIQVTGPNSLWLNAADLFLGYDGPDNSMTIDNGGTVRATNLVVGLFNTSTNNRVTISSANLIVTNATGTAKITVQSGGLTLSDGTVRTSTLMLSSNAVLSGTGTITASVVTNAGLVTPGNAAGRLTINGALRLQSTSTLSFDLGGYAAGTSHDVITVTNAATFAGTLAVRFINGFQGVITNGASFTVLTASSIAGSFANATNGAVITTSDGFATFRVTYSGTSLVFSQAQLTDTDNDGMPNWWEVTFGFNSNNATDAAKDADGDGFSNLQEFLAGADPTNSSSAFRITTVVRSNNDIRVTWTMGSNKTNALQRATGGAGGGYNTNNFVNIFIVTNTVGTVTNYVDIGAATNVPARYYRVRLVP